MYCVITQALGILFSIKITALVTTVGRFCPRLPKITICITWNHDHDFENHEENGFEKLLINHANERLQKSFTDDFIESIMKEYKSEGIRLDNILSDYKNNNLILDLLEGKMGLVALLKEVILGLSIRYMLLIVRGATDWR